MTINGVLIVVMGVGATMFLVGLLFATWLDNGGQE